jgi:hypothetical protein
VASLSYIVNVVVNNQRRLDALAASAEAADKAMKAVQDRAAAMDASVAAQMAGVNSLAGAYRDLAGAAGEAAAAQKVMGASALTTAANVDKTRASTGGLLTGLGFFATGLKLVHLGITAFGAQIAADTVGLVAFGIAAADAFGPIVSNWQTLTTTWNQLDAQQKGAVISLQQFMALMDKASHETGVFVVFNEGLAIAEKLFSGTGTVVLEAEQAFQQFGAQLNTTLTGPGWKALISGTGSLVRTDLQALFGLINQLIAVTPDLVRGFNSIGLAVIGFVKDTVGVVGWFFSLNRGFSTLLAAGGGILTFWSLLAKFVKPLPGPIAAVSSAVEALGVTGTAAFGALGAAAAAFVIIANSLPDPVTKIVGSLAAQDKAVGDNAAGYAKLSGQLNEYLNHTKQLPSGVAPRALQGIAQAQLQASQTAAGLNANTKFLEQTYGLTATQAMKMEAALGLSAGALRGNSDAAKNARFEAQSYVDTMVQAMTPLSQFQFDLHQMGRDTGNLAKQTQDLTDAYNALLTPLDTVLTDAGSLQQSFLDLKAAVKADGHEVDLWTPKGADLGAKLATASTNATNLSTAIYNQTGNVNKALKPLTTLVVLMGQLHLHGKAATDTVNAMVTAQAALLTSTGLSTTQVAKLIAKLDHIPLKVVTQILMGGSGAFTIKQVSSLSRPGGKLAGPLGAAAGMFVRGGVPGRDSVLINAMPGEVVVPTHMVAGGAVDHLRGKIPGFASGGFVGDPSVLSGQWATSKMTLFQNTMEHAMVSAMRAALKTAEAAAQRAAAAAATGGFGGHGVTPTGPIQAYARRLVGAIWPGLGQWLAFADIVARESGWNVHATNPTSGAYGIPQALPAGKMASAGADWRTNPFTQIRWMVGYIHSRWGSPIAADFNERNAHWYRNGGIIDEPIYGVGRSGRRYMFGEKGPETVTPGVHGPHRGPLVNIEHMSVQDETDMAMVAQRLSFAVTAASLGS